MVALAHDAIVERRARRVVVARRGAHRRRRQPGAVARRVARRAVGAGDARCATTPGTTLEFIAAMGEIGAERIELMADMSLAANRPLNWNLLGSLSPTEVYEQQLTSCDHATERGAHVVALTLPDLDAPALRSRHPRRPPGLARRHRCSSPTNDGARWPTPRPARRCVRVRQEAARRRARRDRPARVARDRRRARRVGGAHRALDRRRRRRTRRRSRRRADRRRAARSPSAHDGVPVAGAVARTVGRRLAGARRACGATTAPCSAAPTPARTPT